LILIITKAIALTCIVLRNVSVLIFERVHYNGERINICGD